MSETTDPPATSGWASNLAAVTLFVDDLDESKGFYERAFGLPIVYEDDNSAVFKFGDTLINLLAGTAAPELIEPAHMAPRNAGSRFVFTVHVDDVDAVCAGLQSRGVSLLNGPMDRPWGPRTASFVDPNGYIWEIATA